MPDDPTDAPQLSDATDRVENATRKLNLRHVAATFLILTICAAVMIDTIVTGRITDQRIRNLLVFAGALYGITRVLDVLNQLLSAIDE